MSIKHIHQQSLNINNYKIKYKLTYVRKMLSVKEILEYLLSKSSNIFFETFKK
jgi:hypothetical protein